MSRRAGRKKGKGPRDRRTVASFMSEGDFKIGDFADNPATKLPSRLSKKATKIKYDKTQLSSITVKDTQSQQTRSKLSMANAEETQEVGSERPAEEDQDLDLAWDERDWDQMGLDSLGETRSRFGSCDADDAAFGEEDEDLKDFPETRTKKSTRRKSKKKTALSSEGVIYPTDLWYTIAKYIRPEEVATFSCICKDAYSVTRTATFWRSLYHRHFNSSVDLPYHLRPASVKRTAGLRAIVIQALYVMYDPYRLALSMTSPVGEGRSSPESITDYTCLYTWSRGKFGAHYTHFVKMRRCCCSGSDEHTVPVRCAYNDPSVRANESGGQCILKVRCEHFQDIPAARIMGLRLVRTSVSVSAVDMRYHRVKLVFGRLDRRGLPVRSSQVSVALDPVLKVEVLHWWHPQFRESSRRGIDRAAAENALNARENNMWEGL